MNTKKTHLIRQQNLRISPRSRSSTGNVHLATKNDEMAEQYESVESLLRRKPRVYGASSEKTGRWRPVEFTG